MSTKQISIEAEDWRIPRPPKVSEWVGAWMNRRGLRPRPNGRDRVIGLQVKGSSPQKSLPKSHMIALSEALTKLGDVVLVEAREDAVWVGDRIHTMPGRDPHHAIELLERLDAVVCFDSAVLWMAHAASCPVVCIMGPTRPSERLTLHPGYPDKTRAVLLNEMIACEACFEAAKACNGRFACMQESDAGKVVPAVVRAVKELLNGDVHERSEGAIPRQGGGEEGDCPVG